MRARLLVTVYDSFGSKAESKIGGPVGDEQCPSPPRRRKATLLVENTKGLFCTEHVTLVVRNGAGAAAQDFDVAVECEEKPPQKPCGCGQAGALPALLLSALLWMLPKRRRRRS